MLIRWHLENQPRTTAHESQSASGGAAAASQSAVDIEAALSALSGDLGVETVVEIVDLYLAEGPRHVAEMRAAVAAGDAVLLRRSAHTLKSTSATVGAMGLADVCLKVEHLARDQRIGDAAAHLDRLAAEEAHASDVVRGLKDKFAAQASA